MLIKGFNNDTIKNKEDIEFLVNSLNRETNSDYSLCNLLVSCQA